MRCVNAFAKSLASLRPRPTNHLRLLRSLSGTSAVGRKVMNSLNFLGSVEIERMARSEGEQEGTSGHAWISASMPRQSRGICLTFWRRRSLVRRTREQDEEKSAFSRGFAHAVSIVAAVGQQGAWPGRVIRPHYVETKIGALPWRDLGTHGQFCSIAEKVELGRDLEDWPVARSRQVPIAVSPSSGCGAVDIFPGSCAGDISALQHTYHASMR